MEYKEPELKKSVRLVHPKFGETYVPSVKILFVIAGKHKVKVYALSGTGYEEYEKSCSLEQFLEYVDNNKFERVNKFYILNWHHIISHNSKGKMITFNSKHTFLLSHRIKSTVFKKRQG